MILLDSDIIIDYLKDRQPARTFVERLAAEGKELATSSFNVTEVLRGTLGSGSERAHTAAKDVLGGLRELPFGPGAARRSARLLSSLDGMGRPVPVIDAMIAAIALEAGCPVVTGNKKDFEPIDDLVVISLED